MMQAMSFEFLSVPAAARALGVSLITLRRLIADGQLAHHRVGRRVLLSPRDLEAYLTAHRVPVRTDTVPLSPRGRKRHLRGVEP
jgi:excisionase family DNA binding protein